MCQFSINYWFTVRMKLSFLKQKVKSIEVIPEVDANGNLKISGLTE